MCYCKSDAVGEWCWILSGWEGIACRLIEGTDVWRFKIEIMGGRLEWGERWFTWCGRCSFCVRDIWSRQNKIMVKCKMRLQFQRFIFRSYLFKHALLCYLLCVWQFLRLWRLLKKNRRSHHQFHLCVARRSNLQSVNVWWERRLTVSHLGSVCGRHSEKWGFWISLWKLASSFLPCRKHISNLSHPLRSLNKL